MGDAGVDAGTDAGSMTTDPTGGWLSSIGSPFAVHHDLADIAASGDDTTVVGGFLGTTTFGTTDVMSTTGMSDQAFIARYDSSGNPLWSRQFGGPQGDSAVAAGGDLSGNSYLIGNFSPYAVLEPDGGKMTDWGGAIIKLKPDAGFGSAVRIIGGSNQGGYSLFLQRGFVAPNGRAIAGGRYNGSSIQTPCAVNVGSYSFGSPFALSTFADGGSCLFSTVICGNDVADVTIDDVTGDALVLITNAATDCTIASNPLYTRSGIPANTLWLVHYNSSGAFVNANPLFLPSTTPARIVSHNGVGWLMTTFAGPLTIGDAGYDTLGDTDLLAVKISTANAALFPNSQQIFSNPGDVTVRSLALSPGGSLWVSGEFTQSGFALGGAAADGGTDGGLFLAEFQSSGGSLTLLRGQMLPSNGPASVHRVALTADAGVLVGGDYLGTIDFFLDAGPQTAPTSTGSMSPVPYSGFFGRPALAR